MKMPLELPGTFHLWHNLLVPTQDSTVNTWNLPSYWSWYYTIYWVYLRWVDILFWVYTYSWDTDLKSKYLHISILQWIQNKLKTCAHIFFRMEMKNTFGSNGNTFCTSRVIRVHFYTGYNIIYNVSFLKLFDTFEKHDFFFLSLIEVHLPCLKA